MRWATRVTSASGSSAGSTPIDENLTTSHFGLQFGFGTNLALSSHLGVRLGVDALRVYRQDDDVSTTSPFGFAERANVIRFTAGAVVPIGRR